jgi:hypothetical protein
MLLVGCASGGQGTAGGDTEEEEPGEVSSVTVEVTNDPTVRRPVTVRIVSSAGERVILGSVPAGGTRTFEYRSSSFSGTFSLVAQAPGFTDIQSQPFSLFAGYTVSWRLATNLTRLFAGTGGT